MGKRRDKRKTKKATKKKARVVKKEKRIVAKTAKKATRTVKRAKKKVIRKKKIAGFKKKVGSGAKLLVFAPLLPLKPVIKKALAKKGVNTKGLNIAELAKKFYETNLQKKSNIETSFESALYDMEGDVKENFAITASVIIKGILGLFKGIKDKKEAGEALTATEQKMDDAKTEAENEATSDFIQDNMPMLIGGGIILVALVFFMARSTK